MTIEANEPCNDGANADTTIFFGRFDTSFYQTSSLVICVRWPTGVNVQQLKHASKKWLEKYTKPLKGLDHQVIRDPIMSTLSSGDFQSERGKIF